MFVDNILIAITLNKSSIKGSLSFFVFLYFCVYSSIMIRLDFYYNWLQFIPFEFVLFLRILAAIYSCFLIFMIFINSKQF